MRVTIGIAAYREPLIERCLKAILAEKVKAEVIVACPDEETALIVKKFKRVKLIKEERKEGKPAAVNKILRQAKGDVIVLTDADMYVSDGSLRKLLAPLSDKRVSVVCGHPVITNRDGMLAYWGRVLYDIVHKQRLNGAKHLTTNLCAFRKSCLNEIPKESLVDDYVIGLECLKHGRFVYVPDALVNVKFPTGLNDFLKQRARTFAGYMQVRDWYGKSERSFSEEVRKSGSVLSYVKTPRQALWIGLLAFYRIIAWFMAWWNYRVLRKSLSKIWIPVDSTKN